MRKIAFALALLAAAPAAAQQLTPDQAVAAQLGQQLGLLMHENAMLRAQLAADEAKIKALVEAAAKKETPPK